MPVDDSLHVVDPALHDAATPRLVPPRLALWNYDVAAGTVLLAPDAADLLDVQNVALSYVSFLDCIHADDRVRVHASIYRLASGQRSAAIGEEFRLAKRDSRWLRLTAHVLEDPGSVPQRVVGVISDITEAKGLAETLRLERDRHRVTTTAAPAAFFRQDRTLRYVEAQDEIAGRDADDLLGRTDRHVFGEEQSAELERVKRAVLDTGNPAELEVSLLARGERRHYRVLVQPWHDADGSVIGVASAAVEVTAAHHSACEVARAVETLRSVGSATAALRDVVELEPLLQRFADAARGILAVRRVVVSVNRPDGARVVTVGSPSPAAALLSGPERLMDDYDEPAVWTPRIRYMSGFISTAIRDRSGFALGHLEVWDKRERSFQAEDQHLLDHLAALASMAVGRALLYSEVEDAVREREALFALLGDQVEANLGRIAAAADVAALDPSCSGVVVAQVALIRETASRLRRILRNGRAWQSALHQKIEVRRSGVAVSELMQNVAVEARIVADARRVTFRAAAVATDAAVAGDADLLALAFSNLVAHAVGNTEPGGTVEMRTAASDRELRVLLTFAAVPLDAAAHASEAALDLQVAASVIERHGGTIDEERANGLTRLQIRLRLRTHD